MATRIQSKSRATKRPLAEHSGSAYGKLPSGKPKTDVKGYPDTAGVPIPVLVKGSTAAAPTPPPGTERIGSWIVQNGASFAPGTVGLVYPDLGVANIDRTGTDLAARLLALTSGDTVWVQTSTGSNTLTVTSATDTGNGWVDVECSAEDAVGTIVDGQVMAIWATI